MASLKSSSTSSKLGFFSQSRKNPGLGPATCVLGQRLPISGGEAGRWRGPKGPPLRRPRFNQRQILRAEQHRLDNPVSSAAVFSFTWFTRSFRRRPGPAGPQEKGPVPAVHLGCDGPLIPLKGDELLVPSGPVRPGPGEKANGLQQIGLSLGILSQITLTPGSKGGRKSWCSCEIRPSRWSRPSLHCELPAGKGHPVPGTQLLSPHPADLAVYGHLTVLDETFGLSAAGDQIGQLQQGLQLDVFCGDGNGLGSMGASLGLWVSLGDIAFSAVFPAPLERRGTGPARAGGIVGFLHRRWNGREPWLVQPGPHFLGRNGERTPEGRGSSLWTPSLVGLCGEGCTSHLVPGLRPSLLKRW